MRWAIIQIPSMGLNGVSVRDLVSKTSGTNEAIDIGASQTLSSVRVVTEKQFRFKESIRFNSEVQQI